VAGKPNGEPIPVGVGGFTEVTVTPGDRLTIYTSAAVTLGWMRGPSDTPQTWHAGTGAERIWPVDVPPGVQMLRVTPTAGATVLRLTLSA
jgi:hypothetical protein